MFHIDASVTASISGLTITEAERCGTSAHYGGGLYNSGTATLINCTVSGNSATRRRPVQHRRHGDADQLHRQRQLRQRHGGGLYNYRGTATLTNCTVSGNSASTAFGGGLLSLHGCTATLTNCTVSGNSAAARRRTWINDGADDADQFHRQRQQGQRRRRRVQRITAYGSTLTLRLVHDRRPPDGSATTSAAVHGQQQPGRRADPLLAPLGDYGGPTQTMALLPGSPAIGGAAADPTTGWPLTTDQRGFPLEAPHPTSAPSRPEPAWSVTTTTDGTGSPSGQLSLARRVNLANAPGAAETITFDPTVFATPQTITLTAGPAQLTDTSGTETITGPAAGLTSAAAMPAGCSRSTAVSRRRLGD